MDQIPQQPPQQSQINSKEFSSKYRSKREIYNFLATNVGVYLPPYDNVTIYFLKEIMNGTKQKLHTSMIHNIYIPQ